MDWNRIEGKWTEFQGAAKEQWGKLTDDDWKEVEGKRDQLIGKLQAHYGKSKDEVESEIDALASKFDS